MHKPILKVDFPDNDLIRVGDVYYMLGTTMYFMPGCEILRSYDMVNWEHATYVYDRLDSTDRQTLTEGNSYGAGMWAASFRYHNGIFYICFICNDTHKTYLYTTRDIYGEWKKQEVAGFYHDSSLLFDDDGRVYIAYGNRQIYITELNEDLTGPKEGGFHKMVLEDPPGNALGLEGTHFYKINGTYYLFFIHSIPGRWFRTEACFMSDSLDGEWTGGDIFMDDNNSGGGIAQGAIVDTPDGKWYAVLFQDRGGSGRIPYVIPMHWEGRQPVIGDHGKLPAEDLTPACDYPHEYLPLVGSDDFTTVYGKGSCFGFHERWQFNHEPTLSLITRDIKRGTYCVETGKVVGTPTEAQNTLTQRMCEPGCEGEITVDVSGMKEGDMAGLTALQFCYGFIGLRVEKEGCSVVYMEKPDPKTEDAVHVIATTASKKATFKVHADFAGGNIATFFYDLGEGYTESGFKRNMPFMLQHFTGYRFGITAFSTKECGGKAEFSNFVYTEL